MVHQVMISFLVPKAEADTGRRPFKTSLSEPENQYEEEDDEILFPMHSTPPYKQC